MKLVEAKDKYLFNVLTNQKEATYKFYENHLNYMVKYFLENVGIENTEDINSLILSKFIIEERKRGISNSTINKRVGSVKRMITFVDPINDSLSEIKKLKEKKNTFECLTTLELKKLDSYLNSGLLSLKTVLIVKLMLDTGCRPSELLKIKKKNINFLNNTILLTDTKCDICRYVRFTDGTKALLQNYVLDLKSNDVLFLMNYSSFSSIFERLSNKLNFKIYPYMLRHTHATILVKNKAPLFFVKEDMGHTNAKTTERYVHLSMEDNEQIYKECFNY